MQRSDGRSDTDASTAANGAESATEKYILGSKLEEIHLGEGRSHDGKFLKTLERFSGDEHGYARAPNGKIIHVSKEEIREILERVKRHGQAHICLPEHAEKFTRTMTNLGSHSKTDIDKMVHGIYGAHYMSLEESYRRLDDVYYPINDSIDKLTI
ncbi:hypothetical protein DY000_02021532 [Brassica cretica]|uniref:Uncharacterized protein n=1 Tax=Brassica cretica TaxID=69181 RepID=A0ABQ7EMB4_BRACR|nr:hypothetical protein DY000_02021532 [Brassica cretica]